MNQDQINALIRSVLKIAGAVLAAHGLARDAAWLNTEDVAGVIVALVALWQSHQTHTAPSPCAGSTCAPHVAVDAPSTAPSAPPRELPTRATAPSADDGPSPATPAAGALPTQTAPGAAALPQPSNPPIQKSTNPAPPSVPPVRPDETETHGQD